MHLNKPSRLRRGILNSLLLGVLFHVSVYSQSIGIKITVQTDQNPENISWNLFNNENNALLLGDGGQMQDTFKLYQWEVSGSCLDCYRFEINVDNPAALGQEGYYSIQIDNEWVVYQGRILSNKNVIYIGACAIGSQCDFPMPIQDLAFSNYIVENKKDTWFSFSPSLDGFYTVSTCQNSINGASFLDTKLWIYDYCPEVISDGPVGATHYNDESFVCQDAAYLKSVPLKADQDYIIRLGNLDFDISEKIRIDITRQQDLEGCSDPNSCSYNPFVTVDDGSCDTTSNCGPDLWVNDTLLQNSVYLDTLNVIDSCLISENCVNGFGLRDIVRFSTAIHNIGNADFIVGDPSLNSEVFSNDNCHGHWHQLGYAEYLVYKGAGQPEPVSLKNGFCMLDVGCLDEVYVPKYSCSFMGITAGCYDIYSSDLPCQWIDVTDMEDGDYTLVVRINWTRSKDIRGMEELNYNNNWAQVCINLDRSSGMLSLEVLEDCPTYLDCNGIAYGDAQFDCYGNCGGIAHHGDTNNNFEIDSTDIESYFSKFEAGLSFADTCTDLDGNELLNLYDAALLQECLESHNNDNTTNHTHCVFPAGIDNLSDTVWIRINNFDDSANTFDIEYFSPMADLKGIQLNIQGAEIIDFSAHDDFQSLDYKVYNKNSIYLLTKNNAIPANESFSKLVSVSYSEVGSDSLSLEAHTDAINTQYHKLSVDVEAGYSNLISSIYDQYDPKLLEVFPNPTNAEFVIQSRGSEFISSCKIFDSKGFKIKTLINVDVQKISFNTVNMRAGLYHIQLEMSNQSIVHKKIIVTN